MGYAGLTKNYTDKIDFNINNNWAYGRESSPNKARVARLGMIPLSLITTTLDTAIGVIAGVGAILTLGLHQKTAQFAGAHLKSGGEILSHLFANFVRVFNPQAPFFSEAFSIKVAASEGFAVRRIRSDSDEGNEDLSVIEKCEKILELEKDKLGIITDLIVSKIALKAVKYSESHTWLKRNLSSRLTYALLIVVGPITKAVDFALGLIAATFALLTLGRYEKLNNLAFRGLKVMNVIGGVWGATLLSINPWWGSSSRSVQTHNHYNGPNRSISGSSSDEDESVPDNLDNAIHTHRYSISESNNIDENNENQEVTTIENK